MLIIGSAAHFLPCPCCQHHGHIVTANGGELAEVCNREDAYASLKEAIESGSIAEDEAKIVRDQIEECAYLAIDRDSTRIAAKLITIAQNRMRFGSEDEEADDEEWLGELHRETIH